eukprot:1974904-Amphidinium_carterae.2
MVVCRSNVYFKLCHAQIIICSSVEQLQIAEACQFRWSWWCQDPLALACSCRWVSSPDLLHLVIADETNVPSVQSSLNLGLGHRLIRSSLLVLVRLLQLDYLGLTPIIFGA